MEDFSAAESDDTTEYAAAARPVPGWPRDTERPAMALMEIATGFLVEAR